MDKELLSDKVMAISCKIDQIATIAWVAASADFDPEKCEKILDDVLFGINSLSKLVSDELMAISDDLYKAERQADV